MKLLIIGPRIGTHAEAVNFSGVWAYFLARALRACGIELSFDAQRPVSSAREDMIRHYQALDLAGADHILALGTRYFSRIPEDCGRILMQRCRGAVTQIHDGPVASAPVHCTFTLRDTRGRKGHHAIGWAACPDLLRPLQDPRELLILVDHPDYVSGRGDRTAEVLASAEAFMASGLWRNRFATIRLRRIVEGGFADHDGHGTAGYVRRPVSFASCCAEYSRAHLFMVTHPESAGLTVLETAMAGALPVVPEGFINPDRLATVRHMSYRDAIPWPAVLDRIDIAASRAKAIWQDWDAVARRLIAWFKGWRR